MSRCGTKTKSDRKCLKHALSEGDCCSVHQSRGSGAAALDIGTRAVVDNDLVLGLGGALLGDIVCSPV
jgi:hypothetical protein